jgi:hypothetical protein
MSCEFVAYAKLLSAFGSSSGKNFPAILGGHPFPETVLVLALTVTWLICALHLFPIF